MGGAQDPTLARSVNPSCHITPPHIIDTTVLGYPSSIPIVKKKLSEELLRNVLFRYTFALSTFVLCAQVWNRSRDGGIGLILGF